MIQEGVAKAMILAAGIGSRLKPWTDFHPKALAVVNGKTLLQRNVEYLQSYGINDVVVNVHHFANQVIDLIDRNNGWGSNIVISDEREALLETGGGLLKAASLLQDSSSILLMNVDILTNLNLSAFIKQHKENKPLATLAVTNRKTSRYFLFDETNCLRGWRNTTTGEEKPANLNVTEALTEAAFSGLHVMDASIFEVMNLEGKFSMVDVYLQAMTTHTIQSFDHSGTKFIDVGKPESIQQAESMFPT